MNSIDIMKKMILKISLFVALVFFLNTSAAVSGVINTGLIASDENQNEDLVLSNIPLNVTEASDIITITWSPGVSADLFYSEGFPGQNLEDYTLLENPLESSPGRIRVRATSLPVGQLTAIIVDGEDTSTFFTIIRATDEVPTMTFPISPAGENGINTINPVFNWEPVAGVPFYQILIADQPFEITEDDQGNQRVEGAAIIWSAITPNTQIQYGISDPSGNVNNELIPPLIGDDVREGRARYHWLVLNNYGNHPAYTSTAFGGLAGFEIELAPPFEDPENVSPDPEEDLFADEFPLIWTDIEGANNYFVYVGRLEETAGGSVGIIPIWSVQTNENAVICPAANILEDGQYYWKVIAASVDGRGTRSDTTSFYYHRDSGELDFFTRDTDNNPLAFVTLDIETVEGPAIVPAGTDDSGYYNREFPVGRYIFTASKDGYGDATSDTVTVTANSGGVVRLNMPPLNSSIVGRVTTANGNGIASAIIEATRNDGVLAETVTNISGQFSLSIDPGLWTIEVSANAYEAAEPRTIDVELGEDVDLAGHGGPFVLAPFTNEVSGVIMNRQGGGIALAEVMLEGAARDFSQFTNEFGQYSFTVGNGTWLLNAVKPGFYLESGAQELIVSGEDVQADVILSPQAAIIGGLVFIGGQPAGRNGLNVLAYPAAGDPVQIAAGPNGSFSMGVAPGAYTVEASLPGYSSSNYAVNLGPGEALGNLQLNLTVNSATITGTVREPNGTAVPNASVTSGEVSVQSNNFGVYTISLLPGNRSLSASKANYANNTVGPFNLSHGQNLENVAIELNANSALVSGRITSGGEGVRNARVRATPQNGNPVDFNTGINGNFSMGLNPGTYTLTSSKQGFVVSPADYQLNLEPGAQVNNRNFTMQPYIGTIYGTVTSNGNPLAGVSITITSLQGGDPIQTSTGLQGTYRVTVSPDQRYRVRAQKAGYQTITHELQNNVELGQEVSRPFAMQFVSASIAGRIRSEGNPVPGASITATGNGNELTTVTDQSGNFLLSMQPGNFELSVSNAGYHTLDSTFTLAPGENRQNVVYRLVPNPATISGRITSGGQGVLSARVDAVRQEGGNYAVFTDDQGYYTFSRLIGGSYRLTSSKSGFNSLTQNAGLLLDGQNLEGFNFQLVAQTSGFNGIVSSSQGAPQANVTVRATRSNGNTYTASTNPQGQYTLSPIPAGTYTLVGQKAGWTGLSVADQVVEAGQTVASNLTVVQNNGQITGRVRVGDANGPGLGSATVSASSPLGHFQSAVTDGGGNYAIAGLYPNTTYTVIVLRNNYSADIDTVFNVQNNQTVNFVMVPNNLSIAGQTVNQGGTPLPNIPIRATNQANGTTVEGTSDANGNYSLTGLARNTTYTMRTRYFTTGYDEADTTRAIALQNITGFNLKMVQRTAVIGGNAGVQATITAERVDGQGSRVAFAAQNGNFRIQDLRQGSFIVTPVKAGFTFQPPSRTVNGLGIGEQRTGINFTADSAIVTISGTLVDDVGEVLAGFPVSLTGQQVNRTDTTDVSGTFEFRGVVGFTEYQLNFISPGPGYEAEGLTVEADLADILGLQIAVTVTVARINGDILSSENDQPVTVPVSVQLNDEEPVEFTNGRYSFNRLGVGPKDLRFSAAGFEPLEMQLNVESGRDTLIENVTLEAIEDGIFFTVVRMNENNAEVPVRGVHIVLTSSEGDEFEGFTGADGQFYVANLDINQTYTATFEKVGYNSIVHSTPIVPGENLRKTMRPLDGIVLGVVRDLSGDLVEDATVEILSGTGELESTTTDEFGAYSLVAPAGSFQLLATSENGDLTSYVYNINLEGVSYQYRILTLRETGEVSGTVLTPDGDPLASEAYISTFNRTTGTFAFTFADADGDYRIRGLRVGEITVTASASGYTDPDPVDLVMALGDVQTVDWVLEANETGIVGIIIRTDTGLGVPNAIIGIDGPSTAEYITSGSGQFNFLQLDPGDYDVSVSKWGFEELADTTVTVEFGSIVTASRALTPVPNQASGSVMNETGNAPMAGVSVLLIAAGQPTDTVETDDLGRYAFDNLEEGSYTVQVDGTFLPEQYSFMHETDQGHPNLNFRYNPPEGGTGDVRGTLTHAGNPVASVNVILSKLGSATSYEFRVGGSGAYFFTEVEAPATYRLSASHASYGQTSSDAFTLDIDQQLIVDLAFPSGQITVHVTDIDDAPVANHEVVISSSGLAYNQSFYTDANGYVYTSNTLIGGSYGVLAAPKEGLLRTAARNVTLADNDSLTIEYLVGIPFTPPAPGATGDSILITVTVPDVIDISEALLFWQDVGGANFNSKDFVGPGGITFTPDKPGGKAIKLQKKSSGVDKLRNGRPARGRAEIDATDLITFEGYIPPQTASGIVLYYPQVTYIDGSVIGGPTAVQEIEILNIGLLNRIVVQPSLTEAQLGVPVRFSVKAYDDFGNDLTSDIANSNGITWNSSGGNFQQVQNLNNEIAYFPDTEGNGNVSVTVSQIASGAQLTESRQFLNSFRVLGELNVGSASGNTEVAAGDSLVLRTIASDTSGIVMRIAPEWRIPNEDLGTLAPIEFTQQAVFHANEGAIGRVPIYAKDLFTEREAVFNPVEPALGLSGAKVYVPILSGPGVAFEGDNGEGVVVKGKFRNNATAGNSAQLFLRTPRLASIQRASNRVESVSELAYRFALLGTVSENRIRYQVTLPLTPAYTNRNPQIAYWDTDKVDWVALGGQVAQDKQSISIVFEGRDLSINHSFAVIVDSKPLAIENLKFTPNPFSPDGDYPLSIEFTVHSNKNDKVWVSVDFYNMAGQHVRTLLNRKLLGKGFQHDRNNEPVIWDGLTDDGRKARNGRYLVHFVAEDSDGKKEKYETVVLIK
ncbi:carboxypeptidase regulatory-like domain-containing protein [bacterium]|nr:carboxypeptidase regulatory-like domain-containing protein [bacterium]